MSDEGGNSTDLTSDSLSENDTMKIGMFVMFIIMILVILFKGGGGGGGGGMGMKLGVAVVVCILIYIYMNSDEGGPQPIGGPCVVASDCANWGSGESGVVCCNEVCTEPCMLAGVGYCPGDPIVADRTCEAKLGEECKEAVQCLGWGSSGTKILNGNGESNTHVKGRVCCTNDDHPDGGGRDVNAFKNETGVCTQGVRAEGDPGGAYWCPNSQNALALARAVGTAFEGKQCSHWGGTSDKSLDGYGRGCYKWDSDSDPWCWVDLRAGNSKEAADKKGLEWSEDEQHAWKFCDLDSGDIGPAESNCVAYPDSFACAAFGWAGQISKNADIKCSLTGGGDKKLADYGYGRGCYDWDHKKGDTTTWCWVDLPGSKSGDNAKENALNRGLNWSDYFGAAWKECQFHDAGHDLHPTYTNRYLINADTECSLTAGSSQAALNGKGRGCHDWDKDEKPWCYVDLPGNTKSYEDATALGLEWSENAKSAWRYCSTNDKEYSPADTNKMFNIGADVKPTETNQWYKQGGAPKGEKKCSLSGGGSNVQSKHGKGRGCYKWDGDEKPWCYVDMKGNATEQDAKDMGLEWNGVDAAWKYCDPDEDVKPAPTNPWITGADIKCSLTGGGKNKLAPYGKGRGCYDWDGEGKPWCYVDVLKDRASDYGIEWSESSGTAWKRCDEDDDEKPWSTNCYYQGLESGSDCKSSFNCPGSYWGNVAAAGGIECKGRLGDIGAVFGGDKWSNGTWVSAFNLNTGTIEQKDGVWWADCDQCENGKVKYDGHWFHTDAYCAKQD